MGSLDWMGLYRLHDKCIDKPSILYCIVLHSIMLSMDRIYRIPQFGACVGRSAHPLRVMDRNGTFPARGTATGRRYRTEADARRFPGGGDVAPQGLTVVCCRVSGRGQQDDLKRPVFAMEAHGPGVGVAVDEWLSEIGGGLHCKRKVFLSLRERVEKREIAHRPVAHRDRPTRFGFDWFEHFATQHCAITVVNQESLSPQEEMVADPMSIVPAFSCRLYGLRPYRKQIRDAAHHG